jgi:hypothetical protein
MLMGRVVLVDQLCWGFDGELPTQRVQAARYERSERVDPAPAYAHDVKLVAEVLAQCEAAFPVQHSPSIFVLTHETIGRTNGHTSHDYDYDEAKKDAAGRYPYLPHIVLSGKRIPIHPAMTRYLVAHEYGHVVDTTLALRRFEGSGAEAKQDEEYAKLRGIVPPPYYGPGTWHRQAGEVFANDFRILVCGVEREYWPHPGIDRPEHSPAAVKWWAERLAEFRAVRAAA